MTVSETVATPILTLPRSVAASDLTEGNLTASDQTVNDLIASSPTASKVTVIWADGRANVLVGRSRENAPKSRLVQNSVIHQMTTKNHDDAGAADDVANASG